MRDLSAASSSWWRSVQHRLKLYLHDELKPEQIYVIYVGISVFQQCDGRWYLGDGWQTDYDGSPDELLRRRRGSKRLTLGGSGDMNIASSESHNATDFICTRQSSTWEFVVCNDHGLRPPLPHSCTARPSIVELARVSRR